MNRSQELGETKILQLLIKFSVPAMVGMVVNALYNVVDRIFVGQGVGSLALAGITVVFPLFAVNMAFSMLIGIGGAALMSIRLGQQKQEEAEIVLANGLLALIALALMVTVLGLQFIDPLLRFFGASEEVLPYASDYTSIILWGAIFQYTSFGMNHYIRAEGNPRIAMLSMIIGAVTNTILDPLFIFVFGMGIKGAALATIIAQAFSTIWVLSYFIRGNSLLKFRKKNFAIHGKILLSMMAIGSAPFSMQLASSLLNIIMNNNLRQYGGDLAISAMGVISSISMMILMPVFGINQGAQPIIGYNYGAQNYNRVKQTLKLAAFFATVIVSIGFLIIQLIPTQLISIFNNKDAELIRLGSTGLRTFMFMLPIVGFQIISSNYFQATGKPKFAMLLSLSRQVLLLIPAVMILPRLFSWGLRGVWLAGPTADFGSFLITAILLLRELRHLDIKQEEMQLKETQQNE